MIRTCQFWLSFAVLLLGLAGSAGAQEGKLTKDIDNWIEDLTSTDVRTCMRAAVALGKMGAAAKRAVPALTKALDRHLDEVGGIIAGSLGRIGPDARPAVPSICRLLTPKLDRMTRSMGIEALGRIGGKQAVRALLGLTSDIDGMIRAEVVTSLGQLGKGAEAAIPQVIDVLQKDKSSLVRWRAADTLGLIKSHPKRTIPALIKALADRGGKGIVQAAAACSLGMFGALASSATSELAKALADPRLRLRKAAAKALGAIGPKARASVPALENALNDPDKTLQKYARAALRRIRKKTD